MTGERVFVGERATVVSTAVLHGSCEVPAPAHAKAPPAQVRFSGALGDLGVRE